MYIYIYVYIYIYIYIYDKLPYLLTLLKYFLANSTYKEMLSNSERKFLQNYAY